MVLNWGKFTAAINPLSFEKLTSNSFQICFIFVTNSFQTRFKLVSKFALFLTIVWKIHFNHFGKFSASFNLYQIDFRSKLIHLTLSCRRPLSYKNQSIDLQSKLTDWFLYDNGLRHEKVKYEAKFGDDPLAINHKWSLDNISLCFIWCF